MKNNYNGWTNKQTWNINLRYEEIFANMAVEQEFDDMDHLADAFESLVNELEFEGLKENSLAYEAVSYYLNEVEWKEIAEHYAYDAGLFKDEDEDEDEEVA